MKLQHFAVIFVIIVLPISFLLSMFMQSKIDEINLKAEYDSRISDATYDGIKAFELNTNNENEKLTINQKEKEVKYAIETFYKTLANKFSYNGLDSNSLKDYTPALLFNLYDGFFIQSKYKNVENNNYEYGIRPYEKYSCRYAKSDKYDFIINYTLDNYILIYGKVNGEIVNKSGYLIDIRKIDEDSKNKIDLGEEITSIYYDDVKIEKETLKNYEIKLENNNVIQKENVYESTSALDYYKESYKFTKWVENALKDIKPSDAVDEISGGKIDFSINKTIDNANIFEINDNNNPEEKDSVFYMHKEAVIRRKVEKSLISAIANYNQISTSNYEFVLPNIKETDWEKITSSISMTSFVQGLPIKGNYYNSYVTVSSNKNKEFTKENDLIILANDGMYHTINCKELIKKSKDDSNFIITAYSKANLSRKKLKIQENGTTYYYYPHIVNNTKKNFSNCYNCIVNLSNDYELSEIIDGKITDENGSTLYNKDDLYNIRKVYFTSLAREKYDCIKNAE